MEFLEAPGGGKPRAGDEEEDGLAARGSFVEGALPALAGGDAMRRIEIEENIVPAFEAEPILDGLRLGVVCARMADEEAGQGLGVLDRAGFAVAMAG